MTRKTQPILFLGSGRCYHTMDWFRSAQRLRPDEPPVLVTDQIEGESFDRLIRAGDEVRRLVVIDRILLRTQSRLGDIWRNLVKLLLLPLQVRRLRKVIRNYPSPIIHAHSTYYIALARFASCAYVATPQGSEILVRPFRSRLYRLFARVALSRASCITVDSKAMQRVLQELFGYRSVVIQNGVDVEAISTSMGSSAPRDKVVSIRGFSENYQISVILDARNRSLPGLPLYFCYPFSEKSYKSAVSSLFSSSDHDLGRLSRAGLYELLQSSKLAISLPLSDSSPRSVYEAIFCGCAVATPHAEWIDSLPECMKTRLVIVDPRSSDWLQKAVAAGDVISKSAYVASTDALEMFDQRVSMRKIYDEMFLTIPN